MKKHLQLALAALIVAGGTVGCKQNSGTNSSLKFATIEKNLTIPLTDSTPTPACSIEVKLTYIDEETNVAKLINLTMVNNIFHYWGLTPQEAVDSFINNYAHKYKTDAGYCYKVGQENGGEEADWYNYTYILHSQPVDDTREGIVSFSVDCTQLASGTHGQNTLSYLNFDRKSCALLTLDSIFASGYKEPLTDILLEALMKKKGVTSLESLKEKNYLQWHDLYPSENFLLGKDAISFLYNVYEIAPLSEGKTTLDIPYTDLTDILKQ